METRLKSLTLAKPCFSKLIVFVFLCREYVSEVKSRLISFLNSCPLSPQHAREFFSMFLDEYQALCCAAEVLRPFFVKLVSMAAESAELFA